MLQKFYTIYSIKNKKYINNKDLSFKYTTNS